MPSASLTYCSQTNLYPTDLPLQANPSDILLFHKRRQAEAATSGRGGAARKKRRVAGLDVPLEPEDLEQINIEDLIQSNLANSDKKLEILDEKSMGEGAFGSISYLDSFLSNLQCRLNTKL